MTLLNFGASSDLSSPHSHIDGSKGSKTTVNLIKSLKDSTWYGRGVSVLSSFGHQYSLTQLYQCDNGQSATIATDRPQEASMNQESISKRTVLQPSSTILS